MSFEDSISDEDVRDLCVSLHTAFINFTATYEKNGINNLSLCPLTVEHVARNYFVDIERYRILHDRTLDIDEPKHAAFLTKWLVRMRPIKINFEYLPNEEFISVDELEGINIRPEHTYSNLSFAIEYAWAILDVNPEYIDYDLWWLFLYSLNYRNILDSTSLISEFECHLRIAGGDIWNKIKNDRQI